MVTYPSTHGVFEEGVLEICQMVHEIGGQVYMDGANMNAQVGLTSPGSHRRGRVPPESAQDLCHSPWRRRAGHRPDCRGSASGALPAEHPLAAGRVGGVKAIGPVSSAPWGSASIVTISYAYIAMMGAAGLTRATQMAILNANYVAQRLDPYYPVLYKGANGRVAHECILDLRHLKDVISVTDVAKRLMDYNYHAPTVAFPVHDTLMIEPTESESKAELDRFCQAMIQIREEIRAIENGQADPHDNVVVNAPHTAASVASASWERPYTREQAVFPTAWVAEWKFWPPVGRIDSVYGDRNLVCTCPPVTDYA